MRKALQYLLIGSAGLVALSGVAFGGLYWRISHPTEMHLPLPPELVSLESPQGKSLLAESGAKLDHDPLASHFQTQEKLSFCAVASAVTVLNSMRATPVLSQDGFFNDCTDDVRTSLRVTFGGVPIETLARLLSCHGVDSDVHLAETSSLAEFRKLAVENLRSPGNFVIVNYERAELGQNAGGHISPVSAYHEAEDRFLVMDVARYKYPPVWVKGETLWRAMQTIDGESKRSRGFLLVSPRASRPPR